MIERFLCGCQHRAATPIPRLPLPTPIPQLDANGNHNVPPAPYVEPSEIYDFRGQVATAILVGHGRDHQGTRMHVGGPGTDVRFMTGEFTTSDGIRRQGTFVHL